MSPAILKHWLLASRTGQHGAAMADDAEFERNTDDWVRVWMDPGHTVRDEALMGTATRAITDEGQLIWMVLFDGKRRAYHATGRTAEEAFAQAAEATARRRAIAKRWAEVEQLRRDILLLRKRVRPTVEDARLAGLCDLGIEGFLSGTGLGQRADYPGYFLALMSLFDRQVAYPLFAAYERVQVQAADGRAGSVKVAG